MSQSCAMQTPQRLMLLFALLLPAHALAASADTCDAGGGPCLKLNTTVFMSEMSWYHYTRRVTAGVTVLLPVGSTEQVRCPLRTTPPGSFSRKAAPHTKGGGQHNETRASAPERVLVRRRSTHGGVARPQRTPLDLTPLPLPPTAAARAPPASGRRHLHRHRCRTACRPGSWRRGGSHAKLRVCCSAP
jgi:hypothetical protein